MIKADPGNTLNAVEEMLRYFTITDVATAGCASRTPRSAGS
ncbi:hypothetical protein [Nonomuraea aurantiaca]|nr:hypothetical protein [Nonomuraea aurantiaca]